MKKIIFIISILGSLYSLGLDNIVLSDKKGRAIDIEFAKSAKHSGSSNILWFKSTTAKKYSLMYSFNEPVAGFQFNLTGYKDIDNLVVSGGDAEENGFSVSTGNGVILGFSFKGDVIPAGTGVLVDLEFQSNQEEITAVPKPKLIKIDEDFSDNPLYRDIDITKIVVAGKAGEGVPVNYVCHKDICKDNDKYSYKGYEGIRLKMKSIGLNAWDMTYESDADIYGFQFDVEGAAIKSAGGGDAAANGFTTSGEGKKTVLSFSFTGSFIPAGSGTLVSFEVN